MSEELQELYGLVQFKFIQDQCKEYYTFWYTDDIDGFVTDQDGKIKSFSTKREAMAFAKEKEFSLYAGTCEYIIAPSIYRKKNLKNIDCKRYLNYWNIFSDVAHSVNHQFLGDNREGIIQRIYEKLFYGCNLLVRDDEKHYVPKWSKKERRWIAKVMKDGIRILAEGLNTSW